ncbi:MAG: DUF3604 domain-containing protein [Myxococcota bacterium]
MKRALLLAWALVACGDDAAAPDAGDMATDPPVDLGADAADGGEVDTGPRVTVRPSEREPCADRNPLRNPYFGDLHVHTRFSFDAASYDVRTGPADAYRFARGEALGLPPYDTEGNATRSYRLERPLDFAAVTDHAELLDATTLCTDPASEGFDSETCVSYRESGGAFGGFGGFLPTIGAVVLPRAPDLCVENPELCASTLADVWGEEIQAAEDAYDRTSACSFTTFIGYEWTGSSGPGRNLHRNVFFGSATTLRVPTSFIQAPTPERLWEILEADCLQSGTDCDLLVIPHNGNIGTGEMFVPITEAGEPYDADTAARRAALEPLMEIYQHKGASECMTLPGDPLASEDEFCAFETFFERFCESDDDTQCTRQCDESSGVGFVGVGCAQGRDHARGVLRNGLAELVRTGVDPFRMGFIAATDTHASIAGATEESDWPGHTGNLDGPPLERITPQGRINVAIRTASPGGLAVVWAEENSRPALFDAMRRRETYGTSGTRILARFFGGWSYESDLCDSPDFVAEADAGGVPMGALLPARPDDAVPSFPVRAMADALGAPLQRIQIIKGVVDPATGETEEFVFDVAGGETGAGVDLDTCERTGDGALELCAVWRDPDFRPEQPAFYYARVLENPSCRWSHRLCLELDVDCDAVEAGSAESTCCTDVIPRTVMERAWTSPIWYVP